MGVDTPSNAPQLTAKTSGIVSSLLKSMFIAILLYAALTISISSTIPSPKPVGHLFGFWGGTTASTWIFLLLGFFSMDEHAIYHCRVGLWVIYMFQIFIGAAMVPEELRAVDDLHSISNIPSIIFLAILVVLAFLGYAIDLLYVIATTRSETREDDIRFLAVLRGWIACILAFSHASLVLPETSPEASTEVFPMQGLGAEGSQGNFQSWLFCMVEKKYRRHQVQVQEDWEMVHLLSDMEIV